MPDAGGLAFTFGLGVGTFFSPCGFPMLPAYLSWHLPRLGAGEGGRALARGAAGGLLAALGAASTLLAVGALAVAAGAPFKRNAHWLELAGGLVVLALGALALAGRAPRLAVPARAPARRGLLGLLLFGALYAATSAGCSAPLLLAAMGYAAAAPGVLDGALLVAAFAAGLGVMLLAATVAVSLAQEALVRRASAALPAIERAGGIVMVVVGAYLVWYWAAVQYGFWVPTLTPIR
ncbi:MAG TPA: cytochrome c biogenesis protein CcdA [Candidatus Thermoplasmatota archaeon]|nr:cytochrome c biogenesis protein CcdA [Candidatus Thermoplasmatota archaeon]